MAKISRMDSALLVSPLATLVRGKIEWAFPANTWDDLFAEHEGRGYSRKLTMSTMAELMIQVVSGKRDSIFAAFRADQESAAPRIMASVQAVYGKLGRIDPEFSCKLVRYSSERFRQLLAVDRKPQVPGWAGYSIQIVDGTQPDGSEHRLGVLRTRKAAGLPCKFVVQYDLATGMCVDAVAAADAYASEQVLAGDLFERAKAGDLFVGDRHYALAKWFVILESRRAYFVFRECSLQLALREAGLRKRLGRTETGMAYEQPVEALDKTSGRWIPLRMIIVVLDTPTASGDREIRLLTNLPSKVNGKKIAGLYRQRWTIEKHFNFLKHQLNGEIQSLGRPKAAIFALCMAMIAGNAVAAVRKSIAAAHGPEELAKLSGHYLADEIAGNYRAIDALLDPAELEPLTELSAKAFWNWCIEVARQIRIRAFYRSTRSPKGPPTKRTKGKGRTHYSTQRLLDEEKSDV